MIRAADAVIDSGVAMKWFVSEPHTPQAFVLLDRCLRNEVALVAPKLLIPELGSILWKKRLFQGTSESDAATILHAFPVLPITLMGEGDIVPDAFRIAVRHQRTFYDSLYLALSIQRECPFITADEKLVNAMRPHLPNLVWLGEYT